MGDKFQTVQAGQPTPGNPPQELGVLAAPVFKALAHALTLEQIDMHHPQAAGAGTRSLVQ